MKKNWKDVVSYSTAVVSFTSGILLTYLQYFNTGDVSSGVLGYVAQTLVYAASIFGVAMYWNGKYNESSNLWNRRYNELKEMVRNENDADMANRSQQ